MTAKLSIYILTVCCVAGLCGAERILDVCDAVGRATSAKVNLRGTGQFTPDGFFLGDMTCAIYRSSELVLPSSVKIDITAFTSPELRTKFEKAAKTATRCTFFQLVVQGDLVCRKRLKFRFSDRREPLAADGFGEGGFSQCQMQAARLVQFEELQEGTSCTYDRYLRK